VSSLQRRRVYWQILQMPFSLQSLHANSRAIIEKDEDGYYVASVPELPGCYTQARTLDELMERIKEAVELYLEVEGPYREEGASRHPA